MLDDLRFGWRILRKNRGTTAVACVSLALGIGAATAMFSVIDAVLLNPCPYRAADRIVGFELVPLKSGPHRGVHLIPEYLEIRGHTEEREGIAGYCNPAQELRLATARCIRGLYRCS
jgi:hypothetical protein